MKCKEIRELMPDLAAGAMETTPELDEHFRSCAECAGALENMSKTMALLDEWVAPEPSPYFDVRLEAKLREEMARPQATFWQWLRKPALVLASTVLVVGGVSLYEAGQFGKGAPVSGPMAVVERPVKADPGTAVGDLQTLDKNQDLFADFDMLDDLQVQQNVTANP